MSRCPVVIPTLPLLGVCPCRAHNPHHRLAGNCRRATSGVRRNGVWLSPVTDDDISRLWGQVDGSKATDHARILLLRAVTAPVSMSCPYPHGLLEPLFTKILASVSAWHAWFGCRWWLAQRSVNETSGVPLLLSSPFLRLILPAPTPPPYNSIFVRDHVVLRTFVSLHLCYTLSPPPSLPFPLPFRPIYAAL